MKLKNDKRGSVLIIVLAVVGIVGVAGVGFMLYQNKDSNNNGVTTQIKNKFANIKCEYSDKDLCKFFAGYKERNSYKVNMTTTSSEGGNIQSEIQVENQDRMHSKMTGGAYGFETVMIGKDYYTKAGDVWYKQTLDDTKYEAKKSETEGGVESFKEPIKDGVNEGMSYKKAGKEACGNLQCFKYQVISVENTGSTHYIWFDTKDYLLRKMAVEQADGKMEMEFEYTAVRVETPSPVKELAPNQQMIPGQSEPTTMPDMSQFNM